MPKGGNRQSDDMNDVAPYNMVGIYSISENHY